jgi:hypothetical protein
MNRARRIAKPKRSHRLGRAGKFLFALLVVGPAGAANTTTDRPPAEGFNLVAAQRAADILVDDDDYEVARIAADCLATDIERVTGIRPRRARLAAGLSESAVLIGTVGKSPPIDRLIREGKLDVSGVAGKWESFVVAKVSDPLPGVRTGLVIAGSDRRGTAYGVFDLSESIGVSPWVWWADVVPAHRDSLQIGPGPKQQGPPSVKYRGIFLNDEDWGLQPWAAKTFEPETGDIGPKTYARVCELLLRLKANYLWPAMHPCTRAFNLYPQNKLVADRYAIVMGSSHAEPMLRNNVTEWPEPPENWNYETNRTNIDRYWEERVLANGRFENIYTIGLRGIHDSPILGGGGTAEMVARLQRAIGDQREILARDVNPEITQVPQIFVPYKEVLLLYQNGLQVPADVTLVWPDDNYGYIRQLSDAEERRRTGGAGVYFHLSYWGSPEDYLWLNTTPPALIWEEMRKAYDYGARTVWVANVGDLKPMELGLEFFLRLAWDIGPWKENAQAAFLSRWAEQNFGEESAAGIAGIMDEYFRLNYPVKPEHLLKAGFSANYGEITHRLDRFATLVQRTNQLYAAIAPEKRDAFYELVVYPVRASAAMNRKWLTDSSQESRSADEQIQTETAYYNQQVAGGKWRFILSANSRNRPVYQPRDFKVHPAAEPAPLAAGFAGDLVSLAAAHPARKIDAAAARWTVIAGLGRAGDCIELLPAAAEATDAAALEYDFVTTRAQPVDVMVYCLPTHALNGRSRLRYSIAIDGGSPVTIDADTREFSAEWSANVVHNASIGTAKAVAIGPGRHTLRIHPFDPGLVFDKVVINLGGLLPSQLGPPESAP